MIEAAINRLAIGFRYGLPMATAILATFIDLLPLPDPGPAAIAPHLTLAVVFFWCVAHGRWGVEEASVMDWGRCARGP